MIRESITWLDGHRDWALEFLRMALGAILIWKAFQFLSNMDQLLNLIGMSATWWVGGLFAHYIVLAHIGGGVFLAIGIMTRVAALVQLPILVGAVVVEAARAGSGAAGTLELAVLVLALLLAYLFYGGGRLSVDHYVANWKGN